MAAARRVFVHEAFGVVINRLDDPKQGRIRKGLGRAGCGVGDEIPGYARHMGLRPSLLLGANDQLTGRMSDDNRGVFERIAELTRKCGDFRRVASGRPSYSTFLSSMKSGNSRPAFSLPRRIQFR
jgi:hypothetical protein